MHSRQNTLVISSILLGIFPGLFVLWRLYTSLVLKRYFRLADGLILLALVSNVAALACLGYSAHHGLGKHIYDPTFTFMDKFKAAKYLFIGQVTNLTAMLFAKLSIATFLLYLDFAPRYRRIMWTTVAVVILCNGVLALVSILGSCRPIALNWDKSLEGSCWPRKVNTVGGYVQSVSNVVTDMIYSSAPIVYLSTVQLPKRTQWGLRMVFLFGILAIICSIAKLTQLASLKNTVDPTWDAVDLSIWSTAEVNVTILASCLPPLRSQFDGVLKRILGSNLQSSQGRTTAAISMPKRTRTRTMTGLEDNDYGSELSILAAQNQDQGITKTIDVHVVDQEGQHSPYIHAQHFHNGITRGAIQTIRTP